MKALAKKIMGLTAIISLVTSLAAFSACGGGADTPQTPDEPDTSVGGDQGDESGSSGEEGNAGGYTPSDVYGNEYIVYHDEGQTVEYVFEAECTNLENKTGNTYSGTASGAQMAISGGTGASNGGVVSYLYNYGNSVNFIIVSDREVTDATLILRCGAEYNDVTVDGSTFTCRVDPVPNPEVFLTSYREGGAWGMWDDYFLDYYYMDYSGADYENWTFNGQWLAQYTCGNIHINAENVMTVTGIDDFIIAQNFTIYEGITCISFITTNNDRPAHTETQRATAVVIDCIKIITDAQLGLYNPQNNNGFGIENACTYTVVEG